jgi:succinate dehydrogenase/fumarate reductase cytochrome b subunit
VRQLIAVNQQNFNPGGNRTHNLVMSLPIVVTRVAVAPLGRHVIIGIFTLQQKFKKKQNFKFASSKEASFDSAK